MWEQYSGNALLTEGSRFLSRPASQDAPSCATAETAHGVPEIAILADGRWHPEKGIWSNLDC